MSKQELTTEHVLMYEAQKRSTIVAYLLWFFLGSWGAHYFYIRNVKRGLFYIVLWLLWLFLGLLGGIFDMVNEWGTYDAYGSRDTSWSDTSFLGIGAWGLLIVLLLIDAFTLHKKVDDRNMDLLGQLKEGSMQLGGQNEMYTYERS